MKWTLLNLRNKPSSDTSERGFYCSGKHLRCSSLQRDKSSRPEKGGAGRERKGEKETGVEGGEREERGREGRRDRVNEGGGMVGQTNTDRQTGGG